MYFQNHPHSSELYLMTLRKLCMIVVAFCFGSHRLLADEAPVVNDTKVKAFIQNYCIKCHGAVMPKHDLQLHQFSLTGSKPEQLPVWEAVLDALESDVMPPDDEKQPSAAEKKQITTLIAGQLKQAIQSYATVQKPPTNLRRLTNVEYENTMRDLLELDLNYLESLPEDPVKPYQFNNTAEILQLGPEQIERYLECARRAMASVIVDPTPPTPIHIRKEWSPGGAHQGLGADELGIWGNRRNTVANGVSIHNPPKTGDFRIRFQASAILPNGVQEIPLRMVLGQSLDVNLSTMKIAPVGIVRLKNTPDQPQVFEMIGRIENFPVVNVQQGKSSKFEARTHLTPQNLYDDGTLNDNIAFSNTRNVAMPRAVIEWIEFDAPASKVWPPAHHQRIVFDSPLREANLAAYVKQVLERFLTRAYRRPATTAEVERFSKVFSVIHTDNVTFEAALRETLALSLISPQFLYHTVADGQAVDQHDEIASRLSYFLWGTMPDAELLRLAAEQKLTNRAVLQQQVQRLLAHPKSHNFVKNFTMQWLSLAKMKTVPINRDLFPRFLHYVAFGERAGTEEPYRPTVRDYLLQETVAFIEELIRRNASLTNIIDSDFAMLNQRLAAHYGVSDIHGDQLRPVKIKPEQHLGGLLTQSSVLIGNGTGTAPHPIYRAVWLREAILGDHVAPPPAEVPALVDSAGESAEKALSIKELLVKHRQVSACNDCHARLDPWGIPFEQYNAIGLYQPRVPKQGERVRGFQIQQDNDLAGYAKYLDTVNQVPLDASAALPKGPTVKNLADLKHYLLTQRQSDINENIIRRLLTYALGRSLMTHDRLAVDGILTRTNQANLGFRDVIVEVCLSELFLASESTIPQTMTKP
jgi:hypothetical protein